MKNVRRGARDVVTDSRPVHSGWSRADVARDPLKEVLNICACKTGWRDRRAKCFDCTYRRRLVITGAVHIQPRHWPDRAALGYDVTIVDPRTAFATSTIPDVRIAEWPDKALPLGIDRYTAFVALTHDPKIDDPALRLRTLARDCFYISALGSKKTHARRVEQLKAEDRAADIARIHAPIGLDIGAVSPAEIASVDHGRNHALRQAEAA
jgi:xanthine dehydrogenase accessory factor